jgi:ribose transport system substrate-binding protein
MRLKPLVTALCAGALLAATPFAQAKDLKSIGVTVGDLANPFFVQITKGAELEARKLAGDNVKVTLVPAVTIWASRWRRSITLSPPKWT